MNNVLLAFAVLLLAASQILQKLAAAKRIAGARTSRASTSCASGASFAYAAASEAASAA